MKVIRVKPSEKPEIIDIENELEALQEEVGGYIQVFQPFEDKVVVVCDDDGKSKGYRLNRALRGKKGQPYDVLVGTFLIVAVDGDDFKSMSDELCEKYMQKYDEPDVFVETPFGWYLYENNRGYYCPMD